MSDTPRQRYAVGALTGAAAFVLTYVLVYALSISTVQDALLTNIAESIFQAARSSAGCFSTRSS